LHEPQCSGWKEGERVQKSKVSYFFHSVFISYRAIRKTHSNEVHETFVIKYNWNPFICWFLDLSREYNSKNYD